MIQSNTTSQINNNFYLIPKYLCQLPLNEAFILGYFITTNNDKNKIQIDGKIYFECNIQNEILTYFQNLNRQQIRRLLNKLSNKKYIKKKILNIKGKQSTYIWINEDECEKLKTNYNLQSTPNIEKTTIGNINLESYPSKRNQARVFLILQENQIYVYIIKILVGIHQIWKDIISGIRLIQQ